MHAGGVDGGLVGLGTGGGEERLFEAAGSDLCDLLGKLNHGLVRIERGGVAEFVDLRLLRPGDARVGMADANGDNAAEEVQVAFPFYVPDVLHLAAFKRQRVLEVVGDGRVDKLLLLGDNLFAVHTRGFLPCRPTIRITTTIPGWPSTFLTSELPHLPESTSRKPGPALEVASCPSLRPVLRSVAPKPSSAGYADSTASADRSAASSVR